MFYLKGTFSWLFLFSMPSQVGILPVTKSPETFRVATPAPETLHPQFVWLLNRMNANMVLDNCAIDERFLYFMGGHFM